MHPQGSAFVTFFLLNKTQTSLAKYGLNQINFKYRFGPYRSRDDQVRESAVAYDEAYLGQLIQQSGLNISEPVNYGTWSGRSNGLSFQDILILRSGNT
jgi:hypothetical protein